LNGQIVQERLPGAEEISNSRSPFNLEELKVRWKKAALENCPGVPCITVTVPGPPTSITASAGNASASVAFVAPTNNGGSAITGYTVTSSPGGFTATSATSPINVTGLTNGTAYTFSVVATNAIGNSSPSTASSAVTPSAPTVPGPPTSVTAVGGNAQATISFTAPASNGGSPITGYTVTSSPGGITSTGATSPINVTGLTNGTSYTFSIVATNAIGNSVASSASTAVTPNTVPGPPTAVVATAGNASASVAFVAPVNNGGSAITGYTVTSSPGGITATGVTSPINVTGLTNGTAYTFTVVATNAIGNSSPSTASSAVTPSAATVPGPPTSVTAVGGNAQATISFTAPASNGGSPITGYTVTSSPGGITGTGSGSPITVAGLTNGTAYTFTVVATNAIGNSSPSTASSAVTPSAPFPCGTATVADIDGNTYNTVLIGSQCWTKENLKVTKYNDNTVIPLDATGGPSGTSTVWQGLRTGAYTIYGNESSTGANTTNYGFLYNWYASKGIATIGSTTYKNICPTGWHVPADTEWTALTTYLNNLYGTLTEAGKMKSTSSLWRSPNIGADNASGFTALPGGSRFDNGSFSSITENTVFWSATERNANNAWIRALFFYDAYTTPSFYNKSTGASIRCVKD
jgi:uncharacterized protein (TIGR02145 family)